VVDAEQLVIEFQPDYFFSGYFEVLHEIERVRRVGKTVLLNAGQKLDADFPSHFLLDTVTRRATWRSEDREESYQI
jgi:hypothetical protein